MWNGIYRSFLNTLLSPAAFFRTMHTRQGLKEPLAIGILFGSIGLITGLFKDFVMSVWGYGDGVQGFGVAEGCSSNGKSSPRGADVAVLCAVARGMPDRRVNP